ncbi:MAG: hypothetical protein AB4911_15120 [Oscillochloridaceae bacterium umkhey_bin13]
MPTLLQRVLTLSVIIIIGALLLPSTETQFMAYATSSDQSQFVCELDEVSISANPVGLMRPNPLQTIQRGPIVFRETFDSNPTSPQRWNPDHWDITIHTRGAVSTFDPM